MREPISGLTHLVGAILAVTGMIWLIYKTAEMPSKMVSLAIYGASLVVLYTASAALHLVHGPEWVLMWLRRFDHAAIYLLIAGTYTPFCYNLLEGRWRWGMLATIWSAALIGAALKLARLRFRPQNHHLSTLIYVMMGWCGILVIPQTIEVLPVPAAALILAGGIVYTIGAVVYARQKPNFHPAFGFHELWHLFVLTGSTLHFLAVMVYIV